MASNRLFRAGLTDSESVAGLSDFAFRVFSLLVLSSDDAGRLDGRPHAIRAEIFPVGLHADCRPGQLEKALAEIAGARLIELYQFQSKPYIQIMKTHRYGSSQNSRFPWRDGSFEIRYVDRETRDGPRAFVFSSLFDLRADETPYRPPPKGVGAEKKGLPTETETYTKTKTYKPRRSAAEKMREEVLIELNGNRINGFDEHGPGRPGSN